MQHARSIHHGLWCCCRSFCVHLLHTHESQNTAVPQEEGDLMPKGIYAAASGMVSDRREMEIIAQNLANAQSSGYRRAGAVRQRFAETLARTQQRQGDLGADGGAGVFHDDIYRSFHDGTRTFTGSPFDLALHGDGFFQVVDEQGRTLLTRVSNCAVDDTGRLVTDHGMPVLGQGGPVVIPPDAVAVTVDEGGRIFANMPGGDAGVTPVFVDQLRVGTVANVSGLVGLNGQYFLPGDQAIVDAQDYQIQQGYSESSNVNPVEEMVRMIAVQRRYDASQSALRQQLDSGNYSDLLAQS